MSGWAKPGVKCVCIVKGGYWKLPDGEPSADNDPVFGLVYTVSAVIQDAGCYLALVELGDVDTYDVNCFRPVVPPSDDVALFAHHLGRVGEPA